MKKLVLIISVLFMTLACYSQDYPKDENFKVGLNAGLNLTSTLGGELQNASIKYGFVVGMYYRQPIKKLKNNHIQFDVRAAFKGANYRNDDSDNYRKLNLFYIDAPLMDYIQVGKGGKNFVVVGAQYSQLLNSLIFINPKATRPISEGVNLKEYDFSVLAGYHFNGYYAGWSLILSAGVIDINDGLKLPNILPETGTGKAIKNISFSALVYF
jgi:hypothetical protein